MGEGVDDRVNDASFTAENVHLNEIYIAFFAVFLNELKRKWS